jgi:hypothetical protein
MPASPITVRRILFVCAGNTCRSPALTAPPGWWKVSEKPARMILKNDSPRLRRVHTIASACGGG